MQITKQQIRILTRIDMLENMAPLTKEATRCSKMLSQKACKVVETCDLSGQENGRLMEIASSRDGWSRFLDNGQVYVTILLPGKKKGFHLHHKK